MFRVELHDFRWGSKTTFLRLLLTYGIPLSSVHLPYKQMVELIRCPDAHYVANALVRCLEGTNQAGSIFASMEHAFRSGAIHREVVLLLLHMPLLDLRIVGIRMVFGEIKLLYQLVSSQR